MISKDGLQEFRRCYKPRSMRIAPANQDELRQMTYEDGMLDLESATGERLQAVECVTSLPNDKESAKRGRFLWVVRPDDAPTALETCTWGHQLENRIIKHSNLTGGAMAHSAGELWVVEDDGLLVNAASGRYGAESREELNAFVEALRGLGFRVASMGFDIDNPRRPNTLLLGAAEWLNPHD